jgi:hypothetical protein
MSTTLEVNPLPTPAHLREAVENLSQLVTNGDEFVRCPMRQKVDVCSGSYGHKRRAASGWREVRTDLSPRETIIAPAMRFACYITVS